MGTISDKLMRIINTKEDIRQALISKGYDVPTSIPFKEYAKMISDLPCRVDSFPDIEGVVARYSALGLTNEQMATNPVWVDKTGNGHDLQMKNFFWGGMSGVGGYVQDFNYFKNNATVDEIRIDEQNSNSIKVTILTTGIGNAIYIPKNIYQFNKSYFIKISSEGYDEGDMALLFYAPSTLTATTVTVSLNPNGVTEIPAIKEDDFLAVYINVIGKVGSFTVEQLPLYPGALVFDGVDDYGVCDNFPILTKEKGYTVVALRKYITPNPKSYLISNGDIARDAAFLVEGNFPTIQYWNFRAVGNLNYIDNSPYVYQTSKEYNGRSINKGDLNEGVTSLLVCKYGNWYSNAAIWEIVILDHDATGEELTKIKDYFVKIYPWLFPNQAWTVTGKTNEDADRATIANITGNGNNLVLSNFGFVEGSGYNEEGEYAGYLVTDGVDDIVASSSFELDKKFTVVGEWKFINNESKRAGIVFPSKLYAYNEKENMLVYINTPITSNTIQDIRGFKALTSDGKLYDNNWEEHVLKTGDMGLIRNTITFGGFIQNSAFTQMAFKDLGIYNNKILSKEDCIKAYNYLQTIKSK